jgi:hypothetical protein
MPSDEIKLLLHRKPLSCDNEYHYYHEDEWLCDSRSLCRSPFFSFRKASDFKQFSPRFLIGVK